MKSYKWSAKGYDWNLNLYIDTWVDWWIEVNWETTWLFWQESKKWNNFCTIYYFSNKYRYIIVTFENWYLMVSSKPIKIIKWVDRPKWLIHKNYDNEYPEEIKEFL